MSASRGEGGKRLFEFRVVRGAKFEEVHHCRLDFKLKFFNVHVFGDLNGVTICNISGSNVEKVFSQWPERPIIVRDDGENFRLVFDCELEEAVSEGLESSELGSRSFRVDDLADAHLLELGAPVEHGFYGSAFYSPAAFVLGEVDWEVVSQGDGPANDWQLQQV